MLRTDSKVLVSDNVFGSRRTNRTLLRMAEEKYESEKLKEEIYNTGVTFVWRSNKIVTGEK